MKTLIHQLDLYVREVLGISIAPHPWERSSGLPQYLRGLYRFFKIDVLGTDCVLMTDTGEAEQTPAAIGKHLDQVRARHDVAVVYVREAVTSYNRKRLIEQKVPFIIPGNQMYLPMLGIDLREHLKRLREKKLVFSPATQAFLLHVLMKIGTGTATPAEIAHRLGYSAMTMTRAFDELETADIGEHSVDGKERHLRFTESGKHLWERVLPYLKTPVKKRLYITESMQTRNGILAGLGALARYTMLAETKIPTYAFSANEWKAQIPQGKILEPALPEPGSIEIELWKYSPALFAQAGKVDRLSLYLSLKDSVDERVQSALEVLLKEMEW